MDTTLIMLLLSCLCWMFVCFCSEINSSETLLSEKTPQLETYMEIRANTEPGATQRCIADTHTLPLLNCSTARSCHYSDTHCSFYPLTSTQGAP